MKLEKKQTAQLAVLGVLVVGCVGYLSFKVVAPKEPGKPAATEAGDKTVETEQNTVGEPEATVAPAPQGWSVYPDLASTPGRRDPFIAQSLPFDQAMASAVRQPKYVPKLLGTVNNSMARVPPINLNTQNPFRLESATSEPLVAQEQPEPEEKIAVTGVVRGDKNVAIVRIGQTGRHVVREGQTIDGRYYLASVTGDGAVLVDKDMNNKHIPVKLGGAKNAK